MLRTIIKGRAWGVEIIVYDGELRAL